MYSGGDELVYNSGIDWSTFLGVTLDGQKLSNTGYPPYHLTSTLLDGLYIRITPSADAIRIYELYLTVVYYESTNVEVVGQNVIRGKINI